MIFYINFIDKILEMGQTDKRNHLVQEITEKVLSELKFERATQIYDKYRNQAAPTQKQVAPRQTEIIEVTDVQSLCFNIDYLELQIKALYLERPENINSINDFLRKIKANLEKIKQTTSEKELNNLRSSLSNLKLTEILGRQSEINEHISESINLTVISSNYIINKMLRILEENTKQGTIGNFLKEDLKSHLKKYFDMTQLKSFNSHFNPTNFINDLNDKITFNCFIKKEELDNIKNKIKNFDKNKLNLLRKKSLLESTELQLNLEYIVKQVSVLYDADNFEKYLRDFLSSYTLVLPLNNILIENIKKLKNHLMTLNSNDINNLDLKNLIEEFNNIAFISYDPLFAKPVKTVADRNQLLGFLTQLFRTLDEQFATKVYLIKNEPLRNEFLKLIKNMAQSIEFTKEHLLYVANIIQNSKMKKERSSYGGGQELKRTILNAYFIITLEFPKQNFNKLKNKVAKLIDPELKDENDKKSSYLQNIIYLDTVLKVLQSKLTRQDHLFAELSKIRSGLTTAKIALLTATHLKPESENLDPIKKQEVKLIKSNQNTFKEIFNEQIRGTINCLNSDFKILEKNRAVRRYQELSSTYFSTHCNNASKIQDIMQNITTLLNANHPNIKPIQPKLQSIHLKLDFLKHLIELYKKIPYQNKTENIPGSFLDLNNGLVKMENEFIQKLTEIKHLFKNTSIFDKFLRFEQIIFNPMNSKNISDAVDIELARVRLQNIKKLLDELSPCIIQIKNETDKETANSLLEEFKTLVTSSKINDLLNDLFITNKANSLKKNQKNEQKLPPPLPPKRNQRNEQKLPPPLPPKKNQRNENNVACKKNSFFKTTTPNNQQINHLKNTTKQSFKVR